MAHLFLGHNLNRDCKIDMSTGVVTWPEEQKEDLIISNPEPELIEEVFEPVVKMSKTVSKKSKKVK